MDDEKSTYNWYIYISTSTSIYALGNTVDEGVGVIFKSHNTRSLLLWCCLS